MTVSTMAWSTLVLLLLAHCTGDWTWDKGRSPGRTREALISLLVCRPQHDALCVSAPCSVLGPVCADSATLCVWGAGPEGHHFLHWKQLQHWW